MVIVWSIRGKEGPRRNFFFYRKSQRSKQKNLFCFVLFVEGCKDKAKKFFFCSVEERPRPAERKNFFSSRRPAAKKKIFFFACCALLFVWSVLFFSLLGLWMLLGCLEEVLLV